MDPNTRQRIANLSPAKRALLEERLRQAGLTSPNFAAIPRRAAGDYAPLSFAQKRLWFLNQLEPDSPAYNEARAVRLKGALDVQALEWSLNRIIERHEILRTTILSVDGDPVQRVAENRAIELPLIDLSDRVERDRDTEAQCLIKQATREPFDLSRDLMLRLMLLRVNDAEHVLLLVKHHIASDSWSSGIFWREISAFYAACSSGRSPDLEELPVQYADYAAWQQDWFQGEVLQQQLSYWRRQLDNLTTLELPTDRSRPTVKSPGGAIRKISLPYDLSKALKLLSRKNQVTLFMTLLAAFKILLHRYSGQNEVVVLSLIHI